MESEKRLPPKWMLSIVKMLIHPDYREDIEGDLLEIHQQNVSKFNVQKSNQLFFREIILLIRANLIGLNFFNKSVMKKKDILILTMICLALLGAIMLPFLQGSFSIATVIVSGISQAVGFIGLVFVPVGIVGLAVNQISKFKAEPSYKSRFNYAMALTALIMGSLLYAGLNTALFINGDIKAGTLTLLMGIFLVYRAFSYLQRNAQVIPFQRVFVYLICIPLVAFYGRKVLAFELADMSRNHTINQAAIWITEIESYKKITGEYPDSINELNAELPQPKYMGIRDFSYQKKNGTYNIFFVQWVDMGAVQEVVVYSNTDDYNMKGHFASYDASQPHWKYFWLD
ncbi:MAG: YIP1 family protein [Cyclobacteriaceae bacterium]|nr:YIP1 family protein [Cyclobacteriaceae bacterium]